ncbi:MAG: 4Fe-4S dicluster domain-containing protein [Clostridia bacterium]|nr:4Fe-4S dicluster domain-containing protein [Clostridia bacterium]
MGIVKLKGIRLPKNTSTTGIDITSLRPMDFYNVPLKFKNIAEAEPVVNIGDEVKEGELIAKPAGKFGVNIFSPVCGKVLNIFDKITSWGEYCKHILIMNNNKDEFVDLPEIESVADTVLIERLRESGLVDNIANMPSFLKYAYTGQKVYKTLLVLVDDIDPNCTINQTILEYKIEEVVNGAKYFMNMTSAPHITFVLSDNNKRLADKIRKHIAENKKNYDYKIKFLPAKYPFTNPYIMSQIIAHKKINKKTSFLDAGVAIETAESCYNFCRAVEFGKPVTRKIVTIDGNNVIRKGNYAIPNGVSYENLIDFAGIVDKNEPMKIIEGNLLHGVAQYNKEISISLSTNSIVLEKYNPFEMGDEFNCISCGKCLKVCPMGLNPQRLETAYLDNDADELENLRIQSCIECGCCSYICPSKRYITQRIVNAKHYNNLSNGGK